MYIKLTFTKEFDMVVKAASVQEALDAMDSLRSSEIDEMNDYDEWEINGHELKLLNYEKRSKLEENTGAVCRYEPDGRYSVVAVQDYYEDLLSEGDEAEPIDPWDLEYALAWQEKVTAWREQQKIKSGSK